MSALSFRRFTLFVLVVVFAASTLTITGSEAASAADEPYRDPNLPVEARVDDLLARMTLAEKIGQMVQAERLAVTPDDVRNYFLGSVLSGGGSAPAPNAPQTWMDTVDAFQSGALQTRLGIPILYGIDAVHGHGNVYGAAIFPHNIGIGASRDPDLARRIGAATAKEVRATGIHWAFSPCLCVPLNERWGRHYEGFGESQELVGAMGVAYTTGLQGSPGSSGFMQGHRVVGSLKHWVGDGATVDGDDQGNIVMPEADLDPYIEPYRDAIAAGARTVMVSHSGLNGLETHADYRLITEVLKREIGFTGIVLSDWDGINAIPGDYAADIQASVNAGIDMFMVPYSWKEFIAILTDHVLDGRVPMSRIDDAVERILRVKFEAGLFERPWADRSLLADGSFGGAEHRALGREAVRKSATLLKNENHILPLSKNLGKIFVVGDIAHDIGFQSGGWTKEWQGQIDLHNGGQKITPGTTILEGIRNTVAGSGASVTYERTDGSKAAGHDVAIVAIGERPYAEWKGDIGTPHNGDPNEQYGYDLNLSAEDQRILDAVKATGVPTVVVMVSGRPLMIADRLNDWQAFIAAWLPGTEGDGLADVLFGDYDFTAKLPVTWPSNFGQIPINLGDADYRPLFPYGYGLNASRTHAKSVPGVIEAENYNDAFGVRTEPTLDSNGGLNAGYIDEGDWLEYRINVPAAGLYQVRLRAASAAGAPNAVRLMNGSAELAVYSIPNTGGWQNWTTISQDAMLSAGVQTIRLQANAGGWNLNWIELIPLAPQESGNLLVNAGFETGSASGWASWNNGTNAQFVDTDNPRTGSYKLVHWAQTAYQQWTQQTLTVPNGTYRFSAWARSSGGQKKLHLFAKPSNSAEELTADIASNAGDGWVKYTIDNIQVTNGQIEVGVWSNANAGNWVVLDDLELTSANLLANAGFERGNTSGWTEWHDGVLAQKADPDHPFEGSYKLTHWAGTAYRQLTSQTVDVPNGMYRFSAWVRSGGGQGSLHLFAKQHGGPELTAAIGSQPIGDWTVYTIPNIAVTNGRIEVGVWSDANAGNWAAFDRFELVRQ